MIAADENALICDFAETYRIYDYKAIPPRLAAIYAAGLNDDSRIKRSLTGRKLTLIETIEAAMLDRLTVLVWMQTEDGQKNRNRPKSVLEALTEEAEDDTVAFDSIEAYEAARARIMGE